MRIGTSAVATLQYTLRDDGGTVLDASGDDAPLVYLHGHGNLIGGLERALEGLAAGDTLAVSVEPEDAYGLRDESLVQDVPRSAFPDGVVIEAGMRFQGGSGHGAQSVVVTEVGAGHVRVDGNHPLAGQRLHFEVRVTEVRAATRQEIAHGHVHAHGHDH